MIGKLSLLLHERQAIPTSQWQADYPYFSMTGKLFLLLNDRQVISTSQWQAGYPYFSMIDRLSLLLNDRQVILTSQWYRLSLLLSEWQGLQSVFEKCEQILILGIRTAGSRPGSLTHWKKWYPSLFSSLKMTYFFAAKHWLFSSKRPLFAIKHWLFSSKWTPFCGKTLTFQPKWTPFFMVKHWTSTLSPYSPNSQRWVPKYPLEYQNTPFF